MTFEQPAHGTNAYNYQHVRVKKARGSARSLTCVDCGKGASQWSWTHGQDPNDVTSYNPRCRKCHTVYDNISEQLKLAHASGAFDGVGAKVALAHTGMTRSATARKNIGQARWGGKPVTNTSGVPGVCWNDNRWKVFVQHTYGGRFTDFSEAVAARNALALERYGPSAKLYNEDGTIKEVK